MGSQEQLRLSYHGAMSALEFSLVLMSALCGISRPLRSLEIQKTKVETVLRDTL